MREIKQNLKRNQNAFFLIRFDFICHNKTKYVKNLKTEDFMAIYCPSLVLISVWRFLDMDSSKREVGHVG